MSVSCAFSFVCGLHLSQTYDLPNVVKSGSALFRLLTGGGVFSKKIREDEEEEDDR